MDINRKKYIIVFIITLGLFSSTFLFVSFLDSQKRENISNLQRRITVDLIANETQFDLLKNAPCKAIEDGSILSVQMGELERKLSYAEETQGVNNKDVLDLKKYYSLLEIKDYLLSQEVSKKCDRNIESIIYFYERNCSDCVKQGYILTELKRKYPWLRIYSFDLGLDFSIIKTFASLYGVSHDTPVIIIADKKHIGLKTVEELESYIPLLIIKKTENEIKKKSLNFLSKNKEFSNKEFSFSSIIDNEISYLYKINGEEKILTLIYNKEKDTFSLKK